MNRHCLVCEARITALQLGIDSCRACAVFYRRASRSNVKFHCKFNGDCIKEGRVLDCRSCRFDRMTEVFEQANMEVDVSPRVNREGKPGTSTESAESGQGSSKDLAPADPGPTLPPASSDEKVPAMEEDDQFSLLSLSPMRAPTPSEVAATRCSSTAPSTSTDTVNTTHSTPVLDKIRYGYSMMTRIRKSCELSLRPLDKTVHPSDIDDDTYPNVPSTFGMTHHTRRILLSALYDFASSAFPEFSKLSKGEKWILVSGSSERVGLLESAYRATKIYPNDGRIFISYTTTISVESLDHYLTDCPLNVNVEEAKKELRKNLEKLTRSCKREIKRINPTEEEFLAMLALSFLSNGTDALSRMATNTRTAIMQDLHSYYASKGVTEYATRIGELFCLLVDNERVHSAISEDSTLLGLMSTSRAPRL